MFALAPVLSLALGAAAAAPASKPPSPSHHCVKEGVEVTGVSKKECKKEGGKWERVGLTPSATPPGGPPTPPPANPAP